jgi:hypothetical protein
MKDYFLKGFNILIVGFLFVLGGCATPVPSAAPGVAISESNNQFDTPYYSITVPANRGWQQEGLLEKQEREDLVKLIMQSPPDSFSMIFTTNTVASEFMKSWSSKKVAADYRRGERHDMFQKGVLTGMYKLKDEHQWEEEIGGKKFYASSAIIAYDKYDDKQYLYLYFPRESNVDRFFIALFSEFYPAGESVEISYREDFLETLRSLKWISR